jgi:hypothetical protein
LSGCQSRFRLFFNHDRAEYHEEDTYQDCEDPDDTLQEIDDHRKEVDYPVNTEQDENNTSNKTCRSSFIHHSYLIEPLYYLLLLIDKDIPKHEAGSRETAIIDAGIGYFPEEQLTDYPELNNMLWQGSFFHPEIITGYFMMKPGMYDGQAHPDGT